MSSTWTETGAIENENQVDSWLAIAPDGTVTAFSGKVELGTGVETALAQIVADELDVPFERVKMVMGDTRRTPNEGYTAGSGTIRNGGYALRQASAEARRALLEMASDRLDAALDELDVRDGVVAVKHYTTRSITYAELMGGKRFNREITGNAPVKRPQDYRVVGQPVQRVDLVRKFAGAPSFVQDLRLPGMLHGRVVRAPSPDARLVSLDPNSVRHAQVVHIGNFVAVVSEREEEAIRAAKELALKWEEKPTLPRMENLYDELRREPVTDEVVTEEGKVDAALKRAQTRLSAEYHQPYQAHASMGPSCAVADFHDNQMTVWCSTQGPYPLREAIADLLQMPQDQVQVIHVEGAGCYGHNGFDDVAADAAVLSREMGKPVRVQWSRQDEFLWEPYSPAMVLDMRGGLDAQGKIVAWEYQCWSPTHAARARSGQDLLAGELMSGQPRGPRMFFLGGDRNAPTNYRLPNQRVTMHWIQRSPLRASAMRSLGAFANTFANESFMDELAAAAHADPLEFRLRHLDDPRGIDVLQAAAQHANWGAPLPNGEGRGIAFAVYENEEAYLATVAHLRVDAATGDLRVLRVVVAHDCGLVINPNGLQNQIEGNVVQGMSRALKEAVQFDEMRITSVDWDTYPILKFDEVPEIEVVLLNRPEERAVGAGEPGSITIAPAIANAIYAATGARVREIPFTPKRIRAAMGR